MRRYIDEFIEPPQRQWLTPFETIIENILKRHDNGESVEEIARGIEEDHYLFTDDEEHAWNMEVIENVLNKQPINNRFTTYTYKF